jgi:hypothetical protein
MCGGTRDCDGDGDCDCDWDCHCPLRSGQRETKPSTSSQHQQESSLRGSTKTLPPKENIPAYRAPLTVTGSSPHDQMLRALLIPPPFFCKHISRADSASAVAIEEALTTEYSANNF